MDAAAFIAIVVCSVIAWGFLTYAGYTVFKVWVQQIVREEIKRYEDYDE